MNILVIQSPSVLIRYYFTEKMRYCCLSVLIRYYFTEKMRYCCPSVLIRYYFTEKMRYCCPSVLIRYYFTEKMLLRHLLRRLASFLKKPCSLEINTIDNTESCLIEKILELIQIWICFIDYLSYQTL